MPEPSEILREEHEVITHLLHVLGAMASEVERGARVPRRDLEAVLEVIVGFADRCHHAKEERVLFPALAEASPRDGALLVRRLEGDHRAGRKLVGAMSEALPGVVEGKAASRKNFAKSARTYVGLLEAHIAAETDRLLPLVDSAIPPDKRAALAADFERIEREETGAGLHERYEGMIHHLADVYVHKEGRTR